jgi:hypothetical protein
MKIAKMQQVRVSGGESRPQIIRQKNKNIMVAVMVVVAPMATKV